MKKIFFLALLLLFPFFSNAQPLVEAPQLFSPSNNSTVSSFPVTLSWSPVIGANSGYEYQVSGGIKGRTYRQSETSVSIAGNLLNMGSATQWAVRACVSFPSDVLGLGGECGSWSQFSSFVPILSTPQLSSPSSGSITDMPVQLQWSSVSGASDYRFIIGSAKSADSKTVLNQVKSGSSGGPNSIAVSDLPSGQTFFWQVMALASRGKNSETSNVFSFKTRLPRPQGISPQGDISYTAPLNLAWKTNFPGSQYLWYILDQNGKEVIPGGGGTSLLSIDIFSVFPIAYIEQPLKWIVQSCQGNRTDCGEFSDPLNFKVVLPKPIITAPKDDNAVISLPYTFTWSNVPGSTYYIYEIPNAKIKTSGEITGAPQIQVSKNNLSDGFQYTFKVKACRRISGEICSAWAERAFRTASLDISSFTASPSAGQPPLGVSFTAQVGGQGAGTLNYTFFCDQLNTVSTSGDYKSGRAITNNSGKIIGYKIDGVKETSFATPSPPICKDIYTQSTTYIAKVIVERDTFREEKPLSIQIGVPAFDSKLSVSNKSPKVNEQYKAVVDVFAAPGVFYVKILEKSNPVKTATCVTVQDAASSLGGKCNVEYMTAKPTAGEVWDYVAEVTYIPDLGGQGKTVKTNLETVTIGILPVQQCYDEVKKQCQAIGNEIDEITGQKVGCGQDNFQTLVETFCAYYASDQTSLDRDQLTRDVTKAINAVIAGGSVVSIPKQTPAPLDPLEKCLRERLIAGKQYSIDETNKVREDCKKQTSGGGAWFFPSCDKTDGIEDKNAITNPLCWDSIQDLINVIVNFVFWIVIGIVPVMALVAAYYFMTAGGDSQRVTKGKNILLYSAIGLGIVFLAKGLISVIKTILGG